MQGNQKAMELLRQTITTHIRELAEELLYWTEELNKLEASQGVIPGGAAAVIPFSDRAVMREIDRQAGRAEQDPAR